MDIARSYDVVLSLGDGLRPGCLADASDALQLAELVILGRLVKRAREVGVQVMVEGPGHVPLDQIEAQVRLEKAICDGAPFYVLGPLPTDVAAGYDHIAAAVGGALAAWAGADFLCYVTPAEHLGLPTEEEVRQGVMAARIAGHIADIVKIPRLREKDDGMSKRGEDSPGRRWPSSPWIRSFSGAGKRLPTRDPVSSAEPCAPCPPAAFIKDFWPATRKSTRAFPLDHRGGGALALGCPRGHPYQTGLSRSALGLSA